MTTFDSRSALHEQEMRTELARMKREIADGNVRLPEPLDMKEGESMMDAALRRDRERNRAIDEKRRRDAQDMIAAGLEDLMVPDTTQQIRSVLEHLLTSLDNKGRLPKDAFEGFDLSAKNGTKLAINIRLDADIVSYFKKAAGQTNAKYQTMINTVLRQYINDLNGKWDDKGQRRLIGLILSTPTFGKGDMGELTSEWNFVEQRVQDVLTSPLMFGLTKESAENITRLMVRHSDGRYILFSDNVELHIDRPNLEYVLKGAFIAAGFGVEEFTKEAYLDWSFKRRQTKERILASGSAHEELVRARFNAPVSATLEDSDASDEEIVSTLSDVQSRLDAVGVQVSMCKSTSVDGYNMANVRSHLAMALTRMFRSYRGLDTVHPDVERFMEKVNNPTSFEWNLVLRYDDIAEAFYDVTGNRGLFVRQLNEHGFYVSEFSQEDVKAWADHQATTAKA